MFMFFHEKEKNIANVGLEPLRTSLQAFKNTDK